MNTDRELARRISQLQAALSALETRMQQWEQAALTETGLVNILRERYGLCPKSK